MTPRYRGINRGKDSNEDTTEKTRNPSIPYSRYFEETPTNKQIRTDGRTNVRKDKRVKIKHALEYL